MCIFMTSRTYAVIADLCAFQPFLTVLYSQNALIAAQCVSPLIPDLGLHEYGLYMQ
jgi:hypothetical protein